MAKAGRLIAQAKINLVLRVLGRGADGYHQLETLFQRLELGDTVAIRVTDGSRALDCRGAEVGPTEHNLAWRAALAYAERAGWPLGWSIEIDKRIPAGGGLGGGSADAGAVLRILDRLNPTPLGEPALLDLALGLGADVPFLTIAAPLALAWGRGERLLALPPLEARPVTLRLPPFPVATADAFRWFDAATARNDVPRPGAVALTLARLGSWPAVAALAGNDLEAVVAARHESLASLLAANQDPDSITRMTGSGSTIFRVGMEPGGATRAFAPVSDFRAVETRTAIRVEDVAVIE